MKNKCSGFTLVEVLVALLVVSLGFLGFIMSLSSTADNYRRLNEKVIAMALGTNLMTQARVGLLNSQGTNRYLQDIQMANKTWKTQMLITKNDAQISQIDILIKNNQGDKVLNLIGLHSNYVL